MLAVDYARREGWGELQTLTTADLAEMKHRSPASCCCCCCC